MPGHIKKSVGPDPDPSPWLIVSDELKVKLKSKPYDPKKSCWVPNKGTGGYNEGLIESTDGDKVSVKLLEGGDVSKLLRKFNLSYPFHILLSMIYILAVLPLCFYPLRKLKVYFSNNLWNENIDYLHYIKTTIKSFVN